MSGIFTLRRAIIGAVSGALLTGGGLVAFNAFADQSVVFLDSQTAVLQVSMLRVSGSEVACSGRCRTAAVGGTYARIYPLTPGAQTSFATCIAALNAACTSGGGANE